MKISDTSAIIVCAGNSSRMNGINKQFADLGGRPVVAHSLLAFEQCSEISEIIVVTKDEFFSRISQIAKEYNISKLAHIISGGETRQESVINGLKHVSEENKMIAVHDGARPLVRCSDIRRVIADARIFGGATLGVPVKDTIKTVSDGLITDTPPRSSLYITQTPQVFRKSSYLRGVEFALRNGLDFTDDCQLAESIGIKVCMTTGHYSNIKITTPEDIAVAGLLLEEEKKCTE
ncbi:MAG: 2-C-methyl-D-erythritol 4-phosphate cytidylyltransferase [Oscillospiraceae bacterium]|nr:2-C-methyl-D-erythritol 4-phosphate cytidylyltransferase [Oscillospiraceae bacterium]